MSSATCGNHFDLVRRKGVYPYEYMDSFDRFEETALRLKILSLASCLAILVQIPSIHTQLEYGIHLGVRQLQTTTTYIYNWMYCCWLTFLRNFCLDFYKFNPLHYYTTPDLALNAALRMSRVDLHLISDTDTLLGIVFVVVFL